MPLCDSLAYSCNLSNNLINPFMFTRGTFTRSINLQWTIMFISSVISTVIS